MPYATVHGDEPVKAAEGKATVQPLNVPLTSSVLDLARARDTVWATYRNGTLLAWSTSTMKVAHTLRTPSRITRLIAADSHHVWGVGVDMKILVWKSKSYKLVKSIQRNHFCVSLVAVNGQVWVGTESKILR